jgi:phage-related tail protein
MTLAKTDNLKLAEIAILCFDLGTSESVPPELRPAFLVLGKRLRGTLMNLLSAQFDSQTPKFIEANKKIGEANKALKKTAEDLKEAADTIEQTGKLIGILDGLLGIAIRFA